MKRHILAVLFGCAICGFASGCGPSAEEQAQQQQQTQADAEYQNFETSLKNQEGSLFVEIRRYGQGFDVWVSPAWDSLSLEERADKTLNWLRLSSNPVILVTGTEGSVEDGWRAKVDEDGFLYVIAPGDKEVFKRPVSGGSWVKHNPFG